MEDTQNKATTSVTYQSGDAKVTCTLTMVQRTGTEPCFIVNTPGNVVDSSIYKLKCLSTTHKIDILEATSAGLCDYINAIGLCMILSCIPIDIIVASRYENYEMIYCPMNDAVVLLRFDGVFNVEIAEILKNSCLSKYEELKALAKMC